MVPMFTKHIVSLAHRFQKLKYFRKIGAMVFSSSALKISAKTEPSGDPIAMPSVCL